VPGILLIPSFPLLLALLRVAVIREDLKPWSPFLEFHFPIQNDAGRHDDEMRSPDMLFGGKVRNECDRLDCFSAIRLSLEGVEIPETHLVSKYTIRIIVV